MYPDEREVLSPQREAGGLARNGLELGKKLGKVKSQLVEGVVNELKFLRREGPAIVKERTIVALADPC